MTQDAWEILYQMVLRVTGPWHIIFFIAAIFLGSIYLINLILAIVAMSYDELQKKAEEEEEAAAAEEAAYQESQRVFEEEQDQARREKQAIIDRENSINYNNNINLHPRHSPSVHLDRPSSGDDMIPVQTRTNMNNNNANDHSSSKVCPTCPTKSFLPCFYAASLILHLF